MSSSIDVDYIVEKLKNLTRSDLVEIFYHALGHLEARHDDDRRFVYRKLVLAQVSWESEEDPSDVYVVCPSGELMLGGGDLLSENATCGVCGTVLCSYFKVAPCPVCQTYNGLT
jgi:hypothetical protein